MSFIIFCASLNCMYISGHTHWVLCIAWSPDGKKLASGCKNSQVSTRTHTCSTFLRNTKKYFIYLFLFFSLCRSVCGIQWQQHRLGRLWQDTPNGSRGSAGNLSICEQCSVHHDFISVDLCFTADLKSPPVSLPFPARPKQLCIVRHRRFYRLLWLV